MTSAKTVVGLFVCFVIQGNIHSTQELGCGYLMGSQFGAYTDTIGMRGKYLMSLKVASISHHQTIKGDGEQFPYATVILRKGYHGRSNKRRSLPTPNYPTWPSIRM